MYTSNIEVSVGYLAAVRCCLHKMYTLKMIMNAISIPSWIQMTFSAAKDINRLQLGW